MSAATVLDKPSTKRSPSRPAHDTSINLRMPIKTRTLIDAAANAVGKTRTEFVLESARVHAIDVLLDQRFFRLSANEFDVFATLLDRPPEPSETLKKLFKRKAPWEK